MDINGETKIIGLIGSTYKTSNMYAMYNAAFNALNLNYAYIPLIVTNIGEGIRAIRQLGIHAAGVTVPFKISCIPFLDTLDDTAKRVGAVNVVLNQNGKLIGGNTDGQGAVMALKEQTQIQNKRIVLLGAGGTARAIAFALHDAGGNVVIINRTQSEAKSLASSVGCIWNTVNEMKSVLTNADILINATSVGMAPNIDESLVPEILLNKRLTVLDVVGNPPITRLRKEATHRGCTVIHAHRLLLWQAVLKFRMYTGIEAPVSVMESALKQRSSYGR